MRRGGCAAAPFRRSASSAAYASARATSLLTGKSTDVGGVGFPFSGSSSFRMDSATPHAQSARQFAFVLLAVSLNNNSAEADLWGAELAGFIARKEDRAPPAFLCIAQRHSGNLLYDYPRINAPDPFRACLAHRTDVASPRRRATAAPSPANAATPRSTIAGKTPAWPMWFVTPRNIPTLSCPI